MKRIIGLLALVAMLMLPAASFPAGDQVGGYVAPKFVYGFTQIDGVKLHWSHMGDSGSERVGSRTDSTFGGSLAVGYDFEKKFGVPLRAELEYAGFSTAEAKRSYTFDDERMTLKQKFNIQTLFLNAYWDIDTGTQFTPYLGAGIGMGFIKTKGTETGYLVSDPTDSWANSTSSKNVTNVAWNIGAGLGYDITDNWTLDVGYRFVGLGSVKTKTYRYNDSDSSIYGKTKNLYQHQVSLGARYTF